MRIIRNMQRIILMFLTICLSSCSDFVNTLAGAHFFDSKVERKGIKKYHQALSSLSLCSYLTFPYEDDNHNQHDPLIDYYKYDETYFHFLSVSNGLLQYEIVFMRLDYKYDYNYFSVLDYIFEQPGYSKEILCNYKSYEFHLNVTLQLLHGEGLYAPHYNFENDDMFIHWINVVGLNENNHSIILIMRK